MGQILITAGGLISIIILSYCLKLCGVFRLEDKRFLSNILLMVNLPCVVISGFRTFQFDFSLIVAIILGVICNVGGVLLGYLFTKGKTNDVRVLHMMTYAGYNIGIFTIPFITSFLSSTALLAVLMFDVGNAIVVFGSFAVVSALFANAGHGNPFTILVKKLVTSVPFMTYMIMLLLASLHIQLPSAVYAITDIGAGATAFLAMVLIGILLDLKVNPAERKEVLTVILTRYAFAIAMAILIFMLPYSLDLRKALMITAFSPVATTSIVLAQQFGCKPSLTGAISSISFVISMVFIIGLVVLL